MNSQVRLIVQAVRATFDGPEHPLSDLDDDELTQVVFFRHRTHAAFSHGMRLTIEGSELLRKCFSCYDVELREDWTWRDLVFMDRFCPYPYYIKPKQVTVFDRRWAMRLRLKGSIEKLRLTM